jgi:hypothetical protein
MCLLLVFRRHVAALWVGFLAVLLLSWTGFGV